jgi:hypothetical protein
VDQGDQSITAEKREEWVMKHSCIVFLAMTVALSACASYNPSSAPIPLAGSMPHRAEVVDAVVGADPYTQPERVKTIFDGDLNAAGVLPIQVFVENKGQKRLLVRPSDMILELPDGRLNQPASASAAAAKMESSGKVAAATIGFGLLGYLASTSAEDEARAARLEDFKRKEFKEAKLGNGESAYGFLYFLPPSGTQDLSSAKLAVRLVDIETGESSVVKVPLTGKALTEPIK